MSIKIFTTFSAKETQDLAGKILAGLIKKSPKNKAPAPKSLARGQALVLALHGDLGSGKTTFTQGLANYLGVKQRITSPTFVIMKKFSIFSIEPGPRAIGNFQFSNKRYLYHIDCYRLNEPEEILNLGWQEIITNPKNIVAIEWPEKIKKFLPKEAIFLKFKFISDKQRKINLPLT